MISLQDYNLETIRLFTDDQFLSHKKLMEDISTENNFGQTGVVEILQNYISILSRIQDENKHSNTESFRLSKEEILLYDLSAEIARLCYKHSYETEANHNDWEEEF